MKVLIDTNFFLIPNQFGIDVLGYLSGYDVFTLSSTVKELSKLSKGKGKEGKAARIGLELIGKSGMRIVETTGTTDKAIFDYALAEKCMVATNDIALIKKLQSNGIRIIRLRQKKYLVEE